MLNGTYGPYCMAADGGQSGGAGLLDPGKNTQAQSDIKAPQDKAGATPQSKAFERGAGLLDPGKNTQAQSNLKAPCKTRRGQRHSMAFEIPDDPAQLKALVAKQKADFDHLLMVHGEMKTKHKARAVEEEKARQEALKKQGEFQRLYEEAAPRLDTYKTQAKRQEDALKEYLAQELQAVPESMRPLIPEGDAVLQLQWIAKAKQSGALAPATSAAKVKSTSAPPPDDHGSTITREAFMQMKPAERAAFMKKGGRFA